MRKHCFVIEKFEMKLGIDNAVKHDQYQNRKQFKKLNIPMIEIWKNIEGYPGYQVSNLGRVKSLDRMVKGKHDSMRPKKGTILKPAVYRGGYLRVQLNDRKLYLVHRIVARAFPEICGEWFEGCVVNHKNRIVTDNRAENLETCSQSYNVVFDGAMERRICSFKNSEYVQKHLGYNNPKLSKPVAQYTLGGILIAIYPSATEVARKLGIKGCGHITSCCRGERKTAYGYIWKYLD